ncbi:MAG TPA: aminoglycoside phosphotransferase family protein [Arthrobacter sp.]
MNTTTLLCPAPLAIPDSLRLNIRFILGDASDAWLENSAELARHLAGEWSVTPETVLEGGAMSLVVLCRTGAGEPVVLKIPANKAMGMAESKALTAWNNGSVPRMIASDEETGSFLMEFITSAAVSPAATDITALLARLHTPAVPGMHSLDEVLRERISGAAARFAGHGCGNERDDLAAATVIIAALQVTAKQTMVHGDFQAKNVLAAPDGPVAIDPLPAIGDPDSDLGLWIGGGSAGARTQALWKFTATSPNPRRLLAWAWALAVLEYRPGRPGAVDAADFIAGNRSTAADALTSCVGSAVGAMGA